MKRGEIWTVAGGEGYAGKPRPALILQDESLGEMSSVTFCLFTTNLTEAGIFRLAILPDKINGLRQECRIAIDRIMTTPRTKLGKQVGKLADTDMVRVNRALLVFLGLAGLGSGT